MSGRLSPTSTFSRLREQLGIFGLAVTFVFMTIGTLSAVSVASASAAEFDLSSTGRLVGSDPAPSVFTVAGGEVTCADADITGQITSTEWNRLEFTADYDDCSGFGLFVPDITPARYELYANGEVDILEPFTITVGPGLFGCQIRVEPQSGLTNVSYANASGSIVQHSDISGIAYTVLNKGAVSLCGSSGSAGTYTGSNKVQLEGGTIEWHS